MGSWDHYPRQLLTGADAGNGWLAGACWGQKGSDWDDSRKFPASFFRTSIRLSWCYNHWLSQQGWSTGGNSLMFFRGVCYGKWKFMEGSWWSMDPSATPSKSRRVSAPLETFWTLTFLGRTLVQIRAPKCASFAARQGQGLKPNPRNSRDCNEIAGYSRCFLKLVCPESWNREKAALPY